MQMYQTTASLHDTHREINFNYRRDE